MNIHPVVHRIKNILSDQHIHFDYFEHAPVTTSEQAAQVRTGYDLSQGAKALLVKLYTSKKSGTFAMLVVPGDRQFDNATVQKNLGIMRTRFASKEEADEITEGIEFGGVPPFGNLFGLPVYVDPLVLENEKIIFNAGDRKISIGIRSGDWQNIVKPTIVKLVQ